MKIIKIGFDQIDNMVEMNVEEFNEFFYSFGLVVEVHQFDDKVKYYNFESNREESPTIHEWINKVNNDVTDNKPVVFYFDGECDIYFV